MEIKAGVRPEICQRRRWGATFRFFGRLIRYATVSLVRSDCDSDLHD